MTKLEFLAQLEQRLGVLPQEEMYERLSFYSEMINDRMEEGLTEEEAVAAVGSVDEAAQQALANVQSVPSAPPAPEKAQPVPQPVQPKRGLKGWQIVLIIVGFPVWFPLAVAAAATTLAMFAVLWSLVIALWAIEASFIAGAAGAVISSVFFFGCNGWASAVVVLGSGLLLAGLAIFLFFGCRAATKGMFRLSKAIALGIKSLFVRKGGEQ